MLMRFIRWKWLLALLPLAAAAQTPAMSHLRGQLRLARTDTAQLGGLLALAAEVESNDSTVFYSRQALALASCPRPTAAPAARRWWLRQQAGIWRGLGEMYNATQQQG